MNKSAFCKSVRVLGVVLLGWIAPQNLWANDLQSAIETVMKNNAALAGSQKKIDKLSDNTNELLGQYRAVLEQTESMRTYNAQVKKLVDAQEEEVKALEEQIERATNVGREMVPLMLRMIEALEAFVKLDVPFLEEERAQRMKDLRALMDRADVSDSEKFRRLLEAYMIEVHFGHNIEAYKGKLTLKGDSREVNFLRIGRIALLYMTPDEKAFGHWNQHKRQWEDLPAEYQSAIKKGLRIARKQTASDLIRIPVAAPTSATGESK